MLFRSPESKIFQKLTLLQEDRMLIIYSDNLSLFRFQLI